MRENEHSKKKNGVFCWVLPWKQDRHRQFPSKRQVSILSSQRSGTRLNRAPRALIIFRSPRADNRTASGPKGSTRNLLMRRRRPESSTTQSESMAHNAHTAAGMVLTLISKRAGINSDTRTTSRSPAHGQAGLGVLS